MAVNQEGLRSRLSSLLYEALCQVCGGGIFSSLHGKNDNGQSSKSWKEQLGRIALSSISFPNKMNESIGGKPHDMEIRVALALFHKFNKQIQKQKHPENAKERSKSTLTVISDLGLARQVNSPVDLSNLVCFVLEGLCQQDGFAHDVRSSQRSGIICIVTPPRAELLRSSGRLPCPLCTQWCKGEKGLWWHTQREHGTEHSTSVALAVSERTVLAIVPYNSNNRTNELTQISTTVEHSSTSRDSDQVIDVFDHVKRGNVESVQNAIEHLGVDSTTMLDRNGASLLHWAAGSGQLELVHYFINKCGCYPQQGQRGKRAFAGRTPLHWAARNGHLAVVEYLVESCEVDIDASTDDGTTAFCWAAWQGHLDVMKYLSSHECNVHKANSFGCNAVLWCAQGATRTTVDTLAWLQSLRCNCLLVNSNGHGVLHKAAQRNQQSVCDWMFALIMKSTTSGETTCVNTPWELIGPDLDGCCPSDLAGMEGHHELATYLAREELSVAQRLLSSLSPSQDKPTPLWLMRDDACVVVDRVALRSAWEPWAGVKRINQGLLLDVVSEIPA